MQAKYLLFLNKQESILTVTDTGPAVLGLPSDRSGTPPCLPTMTGPQVTKKGQGNITIDLYIHVHINQWLICEQITDRSEERRVGKECLL